MINLFVTESAAAAKSLQSCPTLCDTIDGSPPGSPVPGILQARTLEWVSGTKKNSPLTLLLTCLDAAALTLSDCE